MLQKQSGPLTMLLGVCAAGSSNIWSTNQEQVDQTGSEGQRRTTKDTCAGTPPLGDEYETPISSIYSFAVLETVYLAIFKN